MGLIKAGIIVCALTLGVGVIGTGASLGKAYQSAQLVQNIQLEEKISLEGLSKLTINSDVPVRIVTTTGEPKAVFESYMQGIFLPEPVQTLKVRTEGDHTTIDMKNTADTLVYLPMQEITRELVVYLPEEGVDKLKINMTGYYHKDSITMNGRMQLAELAINGGDATLDLKGAIERMSIDAYTANVVLSTETPTEVEMRFSNGYVQLDGQYSDEIGRAHV